ncbi:MAG: AbrB/MazE/SpoVT family DNA-binding domain-containing protein [Elusimicrobia bacterium]|nr:AbrB/MazE/SpoVT family DNA-binding domain-containing protein [Elusimicrobiota bacterium]
MTPQAHLGLGRRNQITLPKNFVPKNTNSFLCERREDGAILLIPEVSIPINQLFFWTKQWQEGEREASRDIRTRKVHRHRSAQRLVAYLNSQRKKHRP